MAEQPLQGEAVFEITDYTTATDWERFIANIEEILTDWNLNKQSYQEQNFTELPAGIISRGIWHEKREILNFGPSAFEMRYQYLGEINHETPSSCDRKSESLEIPDYKDAYNEDESNDGDELECNTRQKIKERDHGEYELPENIPECLLDLTSTANDFASKAHCLVRWYNLRRFIVLSPKGDTIVSEDRVKLILSSASVALSNVDCHIPIFVQIHNPKSNFYQGISEHLNIRTNYQMIFYRKNIKQYSYLSELISMFREKISCNLSDPITATIRLNYCLDSFDLFVNPRDQFAGNEHSDDEQDELVKMTSKTKKSTKPRLEQDLRSGATFEQVVEALEDCMPHPFRILRFIHVAALWPPLSDKVITDSQVHSDLDPAEAPIWTMRCVTNDNCNMKIVHETQATNSLLTAAIDYAYDKMDADFAFDDYDRETLKARCLKLSYELATQPEVILSERPTDSMRKLIALLFHRAAELKIDFEVADRPQSTKASSVSEIYRTFTKKYRPSVKEFILRTQISRPSNPISTPALPQRMFCTICDEEFRLCGAFSELCN